MAVLHIIKASDLYQICSIFTGNSIFAAADHITSHKTFWNRIQNNF